MSDAPESGLGLPAWHRGSSTAFSNTAHTLGIAHRQGCWEWVYGLYTAQRKLGTFSAIREEGVGQQPRHVKRTCAEPCCQPGGQGRGRPGASLHFVAPYLAPQSVQDTFMELNRTEQTLPNPPSAGPGRGEREFPGPHSDWGETEVSTTPSTRPRAWSPWSWLAPGISPTLCSTTCQEPALKGCHGGEAAREGRKKGKSIYFMWTFSSRPPLPLFLGHFT